MIRTFALGLLMATTAAQAQTAAAPADAALGRQYLQCSAYFGMAPAMIKSGGQAVDPARLKKLREMSQHAAKALLGDEGARAGTFEEQMKFVNEVKTLGGPPTLEKWNAICMPLLEKNYPTLAPRIEAYDKAAAKG